ncbi:MAG: hypothetical protein ACJAVW_003442, partial [Spirosomataceae bacterium]
EIPFRQYFQNFATHKSGSTNNSNFHRKIRFEI